MKSYKLPNGDLTDDQTLYTRQWYDLAHVITDTVLPKSRLIAFDPDLQFDVRLRNADTQVTLTLPVWFVQALAQNTRAIDGTKFRLKEARASNCETCKRRIHTMGAGRTRRFCADCLVVRRKG